MLPHALLLIVLGAASVNVADDGATSLAEAVRAINKQAAKAPESRIQKPLTEDQVVKPIEELARDDRLSDAEYRQLKRIVATRRLPRNVILRQFVRYNEGTCVQHGWWVRLMLLRDSHAPFSLTIREESLLRRPYTQKERLFQDEVRRRGIGTMSRLVAYFDEDPKFGAVQRFPPQEADRLADSIEKAVNDGKAEDLRKAYYWEGVDDGSRAEVRSEAEQLVKRQLRSVSVAPRRFGGRLHHWRGFQTWDPNLPVLGYIVLEFADGAGPRSVWLEFGKTQDGARLVNYIVTQDGPLMIGKPLSRPIRVHAVSSVHPENGWDEFHFQIDAPDELPALQNANLELWKLQRTPQAETPAAATRQPKPKP